MQGKSKVLGAISALVVVIVAVLYMAGSFSDKQSAGLKRFQLLNIKVRWSLLSCKLFREQSMYQGV